MSLPDWKTGFGNLENLRGNQIYNRYDQYGNFVGTASYGYNRARRNRTDASSNRRLPIAGTSTLWISPSSYERSIEWWKDASGGKYKYSTGFESGPPWQTDVNIGIGLYTKAKFFNGTAYRVLIGTNEYNRAITECLLRLKDQKVNLGENLATARQTASMFTKYAVPLLRGAVALRRRDLGTIKHLFGFRRNARSFLKDPFKYPASAWLEYTYGWKPLMGDAYGAWELLTRHLEPAMLVTASRTIRGSGQSSYRYRPNGNMTYDYTDTEAASYTCKLTGQLRGGFRRGVAQAGLLNPVSLAWDLLPYSFLVDWAIPLGNVLSALDATSGLSFVGGHISCRGSRSINVSATAGGWATVSQFSLRRVKLGGFPSPVPYYKSPFSSSHALTLTALLQRLI